MLKRLENVLFSVRKASGLYNIEQQNRKSTREKYHFFLNGNELCNVQEYTYLGTTFYSNGNFSMSKQKLPVVEKTRRSIVACKKYLDFSKLPISIAYLCAISFLILFSFRYFYTAQKSGEHMTILTLRNGTETPSKNCTLNFTNTT